MKEIKNVAFVKGIRGTDDILVDGVPQVAFIGRSNVGKSSTINAVLSKKDLVKVGKKPGKTTEINFFSINNKSAYLVDLPGYGYAKLPPAEREKLRKLILWYFMYSEVKPYVVVLVLDVKVGFSAIDKDMLQTLLESGHRIIIGVNKIDKLNQKELSASLRKIQSDAEGVTVIPYSSLTLTGIDMLRDMVFGTFLKSVK